MNVLGYENKVIMVYQLSEQPASMPRINVLLFYNEEGDKSHYVWINDFKRLLSDQTKSQHCQHFRERCLQGFTREDILQAHIPECRGIGDRPIRVEM